MKYDYSKSLFQNVQNIYKILTKVKLEQDELINNKEEVSLLKSKISELEKGLNELKFLNKWMIHFEKKRYKTINISCNKKFCFENNN